MIKSDTSNPFPTNNIFDPTTWKDKTTTKNAHLAKNIYIDSPKKLLTKINKIKKSNLEMHALQPGLYRRAGDDGG